jgi:hypothetical protein
LLAALAGWLALTNPAVRQSPRNLLAVLNDGGLLLVPFAVFALMAELLLKWNGVQAFASAGLMASCASTGAAASRQGGSRWANTLGPSLIGMGASVAWMAATALLAGGGAR